ncbi:alanine racemase [Granulicoccus sp. GXG6511]|uniref:alanine racemase n=1 Tax=Granulicoccus sp. GXG6511 TaxID=3381351 RepID=UPI003D7EB648
MRHTLDRPKNWPTDTAGTPIDRIAERGWSLLRDFATPICSLAESDLAHNLATVAEWCRAAGVELAPHGKTTMSPELIRRQLEHGAWAITAATPRQAERMVDWGVRRIVLANVCADPRPLAELLARDVEVLTFVDSVESVRLTAAAVPSRSRLPVLIEVGAPGGRCGVRDVPTGLALATAVAREPSLDLVGVAAFEGTVTGRDADTVAAVRTHIDVVRRLARGLADVHAFAPDRPVLLSAGGSMYPDLVLDGLRTDLGRESQILLRSGCSVIHDHGLYAESARGPAVRPALRVWSRVLSVPEPDWAIIDAGKRDLTVDPPARVLSVRREAGAPRALDLLVDHHNDQHGYVRCGGADLRVGDILELGISHPCLTFDRWTHVPLVDDELRVVGAVRTCF